jgi:hypothetical protein
VRIFFRKQSRPQANDWPRVARLQLVLSKTVRIGDTKYDLSCWCGMRMAFKASMMYMIRNKKDIVQVTFDKVLVFNETSLAISDIVDVKK